MSSQWSLRHLWGELPPRLSPLRKSLQLLRKKFRRLERSFGHIVAVHSSGQQTALHFQPACGTVVGRLEKSVAHPAKAVEPHRLKFWKTPTFDPVPFLDPENAKTYIDPLHFADSPDESSFKPPKVKVRIDRRDRLSFLELLDSTSRLALLPPSSVRPGYLNGVFTVPKDEQKDRMVLDARPPNGLERTEERWIRSLASTQQLQHYFVEEHETVYLFAEDLREFYHSFKVTGQRLRRNALECRVRPWEVRHLGCFESWMEAEDYLYPSLATMAMGDCNAVSYGQASHLGVILQSGAFSLSDFITLTGRPSRRGVTAGLMIDDLVILQRVRRGCPPSPTEASLAISVIREAYERAALPRHEGKAVFGEKEGTFWGLQFNGEAARVRPNLNRCIPLVRIIAEVVRIKHSTVSLLEVISGALISVFQCKRRFMSVMEEIYSAQRGRPQDAVVLLSAKLQEELLCAAALVAITAVDFRTRPSTRVVASDASSTREAAVCCHLGIPAVKELQKQALQKGLWNRLLSPDKSYLREKGLLEEDEELPEQKYAMHPAWEEIVSTQQFVAFGKVRERSKRQHINLGEISAALSAERLHGLLEPSSFYLHLQDSQVSLAALVKGRSSSASVNALLQSSIPHHVGQAVRPFYGFVRSALNPSDDPTRRAKIRRPTRAPSTWLRDLEAGSFEAFDDFLEKWGVSPSDLRGLPEENELGEKAAVERKSSAESRRSARREFLASSGPRAAQSVEIDFPEVSKDDTLAEAETAVAEAERSRAEATEAEIAVAEAEISRAEATEAELCHTEAERSRVEADTAELCKTEDEKCRTDGRRVGVLKPVAAVDDRRGEEEKSVSDQAAAQESWLEEVKQFDPSQFLFSKCYKDLDEALAAGPGILDLFSGERGISKACVSLFPCWCLTFDLKHSASEDLSSLPLQTRLTKLVTRGAFRAMVAGPVCASFTTAITPPCRTAEYPEGVSWCSAKQQEKNRVGNAQLAFVVKLVKCCIRAKVKFSVENPNGSWFWKLRGPEHSWDDVMKRPDVGDLKVDYCMFGCPWQKRTRFRTSLHLRHQKLFCSCGLPHLRLRGRCKEKGVNFTRLAEPYPRPLCFGIAYAIGVDAKFFPGLKQKPDISSCARGTHARLGEAKNPGPRRPPNPRSGDLADVELLEPVTIALRAKIWSSFVNWVEDTTGGNFFPWVLGQPSILVDLLISYGHAAFREGVSLMYFRQLLAHVQRENIAVRPYMMSAWQVVSKWELMEPTNHRPPLPEPLMAAMASLGWLWGWRRWTATMVFSFVGACRVGEVLNARRAHLLLPSDLLSDEPVAYLKLISPKTRKRGARVQYTPLLTTLF